MTFKKLSKKISLFALCALCTASIYACGSTTGSGDTDSTEAQSSDESETEYTDRDLDPSYDEVDETITLSDSTGSVTISEGGVYVIEGSLSDGQIIIDADDEKVQLVLSGVSITSSSSAAIYVKNADKVFITLADGTENTLTTSGEFTADGDTNVDGVIFAKSDLTINGSGTLTVSSTDHGIVCKDDLRVVSGTINITAAGHGLSGKDSIRICGGTFTITSEEDAIHGAGDSDESEDSDSTLGYVHITGGTFTINAGDDGIHAESELTIADATITVESSYEGLEGQVITIDSGTISITASDDGLNAAGGSSGSMGGFGMGGGMMDGSDDYVLTINGGSLYVNAGGDGLDSNGLLYINGGEIYVDGPTNDGNAAIDYGTTGYANGGTMIALGTTGMAENFSTDSEACAVLVAAGGSYSADTVVTLSDADGNVLCTMTSAKTFNCIQIICPELTVGETYTLTVGEDTVTFEMTSAILGSAHSQGRF